MADALRNFAVGPVATVGAVEVAGMEGVRGAVGTESLDRLLVMAREGDGVAFGEIVSRFERMVRGVVLRMTGDRDLTDDLAQEVFLRLWQVLPAFTTAASLPSWLKKVSINGVVSHWRHRESQRRRIEALARAEADAAERGPRPVATLIEEEDRDRVRAALDTLPADLRSILILRVYEEMSYEELAESLGLEVGTVRSRLFRARKQVKNVLERWQHYEQGRVTD